MRKIMMLASYLFILAVVGPGLHAISDCPTASGQLENTGIETIGTSPKIRSKPAAFESQASIVQSDSDLQSYNATCSSNHDSSDARDHALEDPQNFPARGHQERR